MSSSNSKIKRPKISELPKYKPPVLRQLKVTAFFRKGQDHRLSLDGTSSHSSVTNDEIKTIIKLNSSDDIPEVTICDSDDEQIDKISSEDDDFCQEVYCSKEILERRKSLTTVMSKKPKRVYDQADFVEFDNFNYNDELIKDNNSSKDRRRTPFYKRIPYTHICVDAFNFAKESDLKHYVLSHFHADHYVGLTKGFDKPIHCTAITGRLIRHKFKCKTKYIITHELNEPFYIDNVRCTFYDANHCPGAAIILFELPNCHRYLHTGDFRACPEMEQIYDLKSGMIDCCFLDTTFCDTTKTFPGQDEVLKNTVDICRYALQKNPRALIVCGSYCIGKEKVFMAVAEALDLKIWANNYKKGYFSCLEDKRLNSRLVEKQSDAKIHVLPLKSLWKRGLRDYLMNHYDHFDAIVALRPSGWEYKRNKHMKPEVEGNIAIYPVPYSEHSSYTDLERFIRWLRPRRIIPTVNIGDPLKRGQMNHIFRHWQRSPYVSHNGNGMIENAHNKNNIISTTTKSPSTAYITINTDHKTLNDGEKNISTKERKTTNNNPAGSTGCWQGCYYESEKSDSVSFVEDSNDYTRDIQQHCQQQDHDDYGEEEDGGRVDIDFDLNNSEWQFDFANDDSIQRQQVDYDVDDRRSLSDELHKIKPIEGQPSEETNNLQVTDKSHDTPDHDLD